MRSVLSGWAGTRAGSPARFPAITHITALTWYVIVIVIVNRARTLRHRSDGGIFPVGGREPVWIHTNGPLLADRAALVDALPVIMF